MRVFFSSFLFISLAFSAQLPNSNDDAIISSTNLSDFLSAQPPTSSCVIVSDVTLERQQIKPFFQKISQAKNLDTLVLNSVSSELGFSTFFLQELNGFLLNSPLLKTLTISNLNLSDHDLFYAFNQVDTSRLNHLDLSQNAISLLLTIPNLNPKCRLVIDENPISSLVNFSKQCHLLSYAKHTSLCTALNLSRADLGILQNLSQNKFFLQTLALLTKSELPTFFENLPSSHLLHQKNFAEFIDALDRAEAEFTENFSHTLVIACSYWGFEWLIENMLLIKNFSAPKLLLNLLKEQPTQNALEAFLHTQIQTRDYNNKVRGINQIFSLLRPIPTQKNIQIFTFLLELSNRLDMKSEDLESLNAPFKEFPNLQYCLSQQSLSFLCTCLKSQSQGDQDIVNIFLRPFLSPLINDPLSLFSILSSVSDSSLKPLWPILPLIAQITDQRNLPTILSYVWKNTGLGSYLNFLKFVLARRHLSEQEAAKSLLDITLSSHQQSIYTAGVNIHTGTRDQRTAAAYQLLCALHADDFPTEEIGSLVSECCTFVKEKNQEALSVLSGGLNSIPQLAGFGSLLQGQGLVNKSSEELVARLWHFITHDLQTINQAANAKNNLVSALRDCINDQNELVCDPGKWQRLATATLQGFLQYVSIDPGVSEDSSQTIILIPDRLMEKAGIVKPRIERTVRNLGALEQIEEALAPFFATLSEKSPPLDKFHALLGYWARMQFDTNNPFWIQPTQLLFYALFGTGIPTSTSSLKSCYSVVGAEDCPNLSGLRNWYIRQFEPKEKDLKKEEEAKKS